MHQLRCRTMQAYLLELDRNEDARKELERLMTVAISRFFRDRRLWEILGDRILPAMIEEAKVGVKVWSAGCACGEEVYSLKILWDIMGGRFQNLPRLYIWATDMNPVYLTKARTGAYPRSSLKEVPEALRDKYFRARAKGGYAVIESLKEGIVWLGHNLLSEPPGNEFQLVFVRNGLLTYYEEHLKKPAFQKVADSLAHSGYIIIGTHEEIPAGIQGLLPSRHHPCIYQKGLSVVRGSSIAPSGS